MYRIAAFAALLGLAATPGAGAQTADTTALAPMYARVDSLLRVREQMRGALHRQDSIDRVRRAAAARGKIDSAQVGPFLVVGHKDRLERHASLFERVWTARGQPLGVAPGLRGVVFLIGDGFTADVYGELRARAHHHDLNIGQLKRYNRQEEIVWRALGGAATARLSPALREWLEGGPVGDDTLRALPRVYRELATVAGQTVQACYEGAAARCLEVLGITPQESKPSLSATARASFLDQLLRESQPAGFARLLQAGDQPVHQLLAAIAPGGLDAAAARWQQRVRAAKPEPQKATAASGAVTLVWIALLVLFTTRSTRWRLR